MKKNKCVYCGNNSVPHFLNWYFESADILLSPLRRVLTRSPFAWLVKNFWKVFNLPLKFVNLGFFFRVISFQEDILKCKVKRAQVLWEEALRRGIKMKELLLFGKPFDCYLAEKSEIRNPKSDLPTDLSSIALAKGEVSTKGGKNFKSKILNLKSKMVFSGLPRPANYNNSSLDWMDDKRIFKKHFMKAGLPVPKGGSCWSWGQAKKIFGQVQKSVASPPEAGPPMAEVKNYELRNKASKPVIVKPRAGSRGRHSTTFVYTLEDLKQAYKIAKKLCFWVIVEEQLMGPVFRATLINYELCGVLRGDPPQIIGDGAHNIEELITIKNSQPHPGVKDVIIDEGMEKFIERQISVKLKAKSEKLWSLPAANSYFNYIPALGEIIQLSEKIGVNYGGSSSEDFEICHPDNKELFIRAAKVLGDPVVGFDFIIPDITKSWKEQNCGFIEANSLPFINLHHDPLLGAPRNVAAKVWEMMGI